MQPQPIYVEVISLMSKVWKYYNTCLVKSDTNISPNKFFIVDKVPNEVFLVFHLKLQTQSFRGVFGIKKKYFLK